MSLITAAIVIVPLAAFSPYKRTAAIEPRLPDTFKVSISLPDSTTVPATARAPKAAPAAASSPSTATEPGCGQFGSRSTGTSTSIHDDSDSPDSRRLNFVQRTPNRCVEAMFWGRVVLSYDERDIVSMGRNAHAWFREVAGGVDRELAFSGVGYDLKRSYSVNGIPATFDEPARAWLATIVRQTVIESGYNAQARVARLEQEGGTDRVLGEIAEMKSTGARRNYYEVLLSRTLSAIDVSKILTRVRRDLAGSSGDLRSVLQKVDARLVQSAPVRGQFADAVASLESDGDKSSLLSQLVFTADHDLLIDIMRVARTIGSDGDKSRLLISSAARYLTGRDAALREPYFTTYETLESAGDRSRVLISAVSFGHGDPAVTEAIIVGTHRIDSSGDQARALIAVADARLLSTPRLRDAYLAAAKRIDSDGDRGVFFAPGRCDRMDTILRDLSFAARTLRRQPAFTATVITTLALAIGVSTAIFSVVEATLLRGLPFRTPDRVAFLWGVAGPQRAIRGASVIEVQDWARLNRVFEAVAIYDETSLNLRTTAGADQVEAEMVSASYFGMLGASAQIGRAFTPDEDRVPDANAVVVISDGMWRGRFGGDPNIVGRTLTLNERPSTVVGVMKPGFKGISFDTDVWFPAMMAHVNGAPTDLTSRGSRWLGAVGRLRPGVGLEPAQRDIDRVARQLAKDFPESNKDRGVQLFSLRDSYLGSTRGLVLALFGAVGLLLLIACTNVVALQLVRASRRGRELALRISIGAGRARLVQQLVVEALVLAAAAAILGLGVASWALKGLTLLAPAGVLPPYATPSIDFTAFAFAIVVAAGCGLAFGAIPAFRASRLDLIGSLKEGTRGSSSGLGRRGRLGVQQLLVVAETAVALVLLIGAGLFVRSLQRQLAVSPGFDAAHVLRARLALPDRYTAPMRAQFAEQLRDRLAAIPSVSAVAIGSDLPLGGSSSAARVYVPEAGQSVRFYRHSVSTGYFDALRIPIVAGRAFASTDRDGSLPVVTIGQAMARRFWGNESAIGKRLRLGDANGPEVTVVGVVSDVRYRDLTTQLATSEPDVFFPMAQRPAATVQVAIRSSLPPEQLAAALRRELAALDPAIPVFGIRPLGALLADQTAQARFGSSVLSVFGVVALVLTAVGLYGVLAFLVALQRREIGIRIALGAPIRSVVGGVIGHGTRLVAIGAVIGLAIAALATRAITSQLYGVGARDPGVFIGVTATLLAVAFVASSAPARRAARIDPQVALRDE